MDEFLFLLQAKLTDWPTIAVGLAAGLLAWSRSGVALMMAAAALAAEIIIMLVRGWPIRPYWLLVGLVAVLPWAMLGFAFRAMVLALARKRDSGSP
jgi:hypothetical protein